MMRRALDYQLAGHLDEAAEVYTTVLAKAPHTHDALHMLGAIKLRRGELAEAQRLIVAAMRLRPAYASIEHNLQMVRDAEFASERLSARPSPNLARQLVEKHDAAVFIDADVDHALDRPTAEDR